MNPAPRTFAALRALLIGLALATSACEAQDSSPTLTDLPATLLGTWQVTDVRLDRGDTNPWPYKFNTHKYLGRIVVFAPERLTYNMKWWAGDKQVCETPKIDMRRTTALRVVSASLGTRPFQPTRPGPKDFGLPLVDSAPVEVLSLVCSNELMGVIGRAKIPNEKTHPDYVPGIWFIVLNPDELALRWEEEVFLILKRLPNDTKPLASFDCDKAATGTEKTICGSVALAAFDVSVAGSYRHALGYYDFALRTYDPPIKQQTLKQLAAFKQSQKDWLKKRDACASDAACLERAMGERILEINQEIADYAYDNRGFREISDEPYGSRKW